MQDETAGGEMLARNCGGIEEEREERGERKERRERRGEIHPKEAKYDVPGPVVRGERLSENPAPWLPLLQAPRTFDPRQP